MEKTDYSRHENVTFWHGYMENQKMGTDYNGLTFVVNFNFLTTSISELTDSNMFENCNVWFELEVRMLYSEKYSTNQFF